MKKFCLDIILITMLIAVMNFHALPKILHEIIGVVGAVALAVHIAWNLRALRSIPKFYIAIDALMLVGVLTITFTGVCISNHLFNGLVDMKLQRSIFIHQLHTSLPFALMILIGLHLGRNWSNFHQRLQKILPLNPTVEKFFAAVLIVAGLFGVYMDQLLDRLMMHHIFGTPATQLALGLYALLVIGMLALFTSIGIFVDRLIKKI